MNIGIIISVTAVTANVLLGFIALLNNPKNTVNRIVTILAWVTSAWIIVNSLSVVGISLQFNLFLIRLSVFLAVPQILAVYFLAHTLPESKLRISAKHSIAMLIIGTVIMVLSLTPFVFSGIILESGVSAVPGIGMAAFALFAVFTSISAIYEFTKNLRKSNGVARQQIKYIMVGITVMFTLIIFTVLIPVAVFNFSGLVQFSPLYTLIFLSSTTYAVVRHRFLDIRVLIARTISYSAMILLIVAGYVIILIGITNLIPGVELTYSMVASLSAVSIVLFFSAGPLQRTVQDITDKVFFKAGYDTEKILSDITQQMASTIELDELSKSIFNILTANVKVTKGAFVLVHDHKINTVKATGFDESSLTENTWIERLLHTGRNSFVYEELTDDSLKEKFRELDISLALPLKVEEKEIGIFLIGPKASGEVYSAQDLELIEILAPQLAVALQNAESLVEIKEFSKKLEQRVEERTRELKEVQKSELDKAREVIRLKDEFVFIATHDLRTPATAIKGFISLIKETSANYNLPETVVEDIEAIQQSADRLMQLVDDLLEVARSESGTIKIDVQETDVKPIIDAVLQEVHPSAEERKITITTDISPNSNVMADSEKLQEIIENLLSNAVKYNRDGGTIIFKTYLDDDMLHFSVTDTGLGIPADMQEKVFTKFFRAHQKGTEEVPGTGLGLFVVRMLVEKMKGEISFTSTEGKGTTFTFSLPIAK